MTYKYDNVKLSSIVTIDIIPEILNNFSKLQEILIETKFFGQKPELVDFLALSNSYHIEFQKKTEILSCELTLNGFSTIKQDTEFQKSSKWNDNLDKWESFIESIDFKFRFANSGICTIRADFNFKFNNSISTLELLSIIDDINYFMDFNIFRKYLFDKLLRVLDDAFIITQNQDVLDDFLTYPVLSSADSHLNSLDEKEICGIAWRNHEYEKLNKKMVNTLLENDISPYDTSIFVIAHPATCMFFPEKSQLYLESRIKVIEMFFRQKYILKRIDYNLKSLFNQLKSPKDDLTLKKAITIIEQNHIDVYSNFGIYRNSNFAVADMFSMIIDTFTIVFKQDKEYLAIQENLKTCDSLYHGYVNDRKNEIMEIIQWIILGFGAFTVVSTVLFGAIFKNIEVDPIIEIDLIFSISWIIILLAYLIIKYNMGDVQRKKRIN